MPFARIWIDPESIIQSEVNQKEKNKYGILMQLCGIQKNVQINIFVKQICLFAYLQKQITNVWMPRGNEGGWDELGDWD